MPDTVALLSPVEAAKSRRDKRQKARPGHSTDAEWAARTSANSFGCVQLSPEFTACAIPLCAARAAVEVEFAVELDRQDGGMRGKGGRGWRGDPTHAGRLTEAADDAMVK